MASYTRQSSFSDGDTISASLFNNEYNQLVTAFSYASSGTTGHRHDGTAGEGGNIHTIGDQDFLNKIVVDSTNNRWGFYVQVSSSAVEQIRIQDGAIVPVTDSDIDLGTSSLEFKDLYIDGTASIDSLTLTSGATVTVIFDEDDMSSDSATGLATQQSIKAYVDSQFTGQTLEFSGDSGGTLSIDLDSETLTITGGTGIATTGSTNDMSIAIDSTVATLTGSQTLTNKTLTAPVISSISNTGTLTLPTSTDTLVGRATTDTLTNKTISSASNTITVNLGSATVTGTLAQFNTALSDGSFVSLAGSETLTNKTLTSPTLTSPVITTPQINDTSADHQYVFAVSELAADRTVTLPLLTGNDTFVFESHTQTLTNKTLTAPVISTISNSGTVTLPTGTTTLVGTGTSDVLTNKTISGASNTLSNIGNSSLSNSSVSFGGVSVSLGSSDATPAFDLSDATGYTGDSNLVTTGTISSGVWQGTAIADAYVANNLTISGGTVDNTVIGGTTAAAGTFTSLNVTGDLTVSGTTTTVNSTTVTFDDIVLTLGGDTAPAADDNKDRGLEFRWHNGSAAKLGFFGYDDSASVFTFIPDATNSLGAYSGTAGDVSFGAGTFTTVTADGGVSVDNITIDGTEIDLSSGDLTIDVAGQIVLDADGGEIQLKDGGTEFGQLAKSGNDFRINQAIQDGDIVFRGNDGGSVITALTLDFSDAGAATFNSSATATSFVTTAGGTFTTASGNDLNIVYPSTRSLFIKEGSETHVTVDNTGKVGIGVSPSSPLHVNVGTNLNFEVENSSSTLRLSALNDARDANIAMQFASSSFQFITGDVGIGSTTVDRGKLHVNHIVQSSGGAFNDPHIALSFSSAPTDNDSFAGISYATSDSDNYGWTVGAERTSGGVGDFIFTQHNNSATGSEKVRIDSSGNVQIGNSTYGANLGQLRVVNDASSTPASISLMGYGNVTDNAEVGKLEFALQQSGTGGQVHAKISGLASGTNEDEGQLAFYTSDNTLTERMRIDEDGNLLVGQTAVADTEGLAIRPNATEGACQLIFNRTSRTATSYITDFQNGGSTVGYISYTKKYL